MSRGSSSNKYERARDLQTNIDSYKNFLFFEKLYCHNKFYDTKF